MKRIETGDLAALFSKIRQPFHDGYYAMYSSWYGGIVTEPLLMTVPIDDHMVHRGDGVFETFKCVDGALYNLTAHLQRLQSSATSVHLDMPASLERVVELTVETVRVGGHRDALVRMFVSRGPGSFGVSPYDSPAPQLYIVSAKLPRPFMELHPAGATVLTSAIPPKPPFMAGIKNCNYLPNVLMKKESVDAGVDFVMSFNADGCLCEGPTENMGIVTRERELLFPRLGDILCGTTMMRVMQLAETAVERAIIATVGFRDIRHADIAEAAEAVIVGTTPNVTHVREFDGRLVNGGLPGPAFLALHRLLEEDIHHNAVLRTPVPGL